MKDWLQSVVLGRRKDHITFNMAKDWSKGDVIQLVAMVIGIPAAISAIVVIAVVMKRYRKHLQGQSVF